MTETRNVVHGDGVQTGDSSFFLLLLPLLKIGNPLLFLFFFDSLRHEPLRLTRGIN